jgi:hypothetical protein
LGLCRCDDDEKGRNPIPSAGLIPYNDRLKSRVALSLCVHHYPIAGLLKILPGSRPEHDVPGIVAAHIIRLLREGFDSQRDVAGIEPFQGERPI